MPTATRAARRPLIALVALLLMVGAVGCGDSKKTKETSSSVSCAGDECDISLSGTGAETDVRGLTLKLEDTDGDKAKVNVGPTDGTENKTLELEKGEKSRAYGAYITLQSIDGDDVDVHAAPAP
jgi:hypothetical protein